MAVRLAIIHARTVLYGIISKEPPPPTFLPWESVRRPVLTHPPCTCRSTQTPNSLGGGLFSALGDLATSSKNLIQQDLSNGPMFETQSLGDEQKVEI